MDCFLRSMMGWAFSSPAVVFLQLWIVSRPQRREAVERLRVKSTVKKTTMVCRPMEKEKEEEATATATLVHEQRLWAKKTTIVRRPMEEAEAEATATVVLEQRPRANVTVKQNFFWLAAANHDA